MFPVCIHMLSTSSARPGSSPTSTRLCDEDSDLWVGETQTQILQFTSACSFSWFPNWGDRS